MKGVNNMSKKTTIVRVTDEYAELAMLNAKVDAHRARGKYLAKKEKKHEAAAIARLVAAIVCMAGLILTAAAVGASAPWYCIPSCVVSSILLAFFGGLVC